MPEPITPPESIDHDDFALHLNLARRHGWTVPNPEQDSAGPAPWLAYWRGMNHMLHVRSLDTNARPPRPVQPHTPGMRGDEDYFEKAERINRNRAIWKGYLP